MIKHCAFVGFSHGSVWWQLHSCSPHSCPRSALAHNFTAEWPGTNDEAPHPSYLCCLRSSAYACGCFGHYFEEQVCPEHMTLRWLREQMDGRVDSGCAYPFWHCAQVKLLTEVRKWKHRARIRQTPVGCLGLGSEARNLARAKSMMTWWRLCFISAQCTQHGSTWELAADELCVLILHCSALLLSVESFYWLLHLHRHKKLVFFLFYFIYKHFST